jgi:uncharacterized RDD family membrane protein YckC
MLDTATEIETPEHVRFRYRLAGPTRRSGAWLADLFVRGLIAGALAIALSAFNVLDEKHNPGNGILLVGVFLLEWGYFVVCETLMGGRSVGKRWLDLRVVKEDGRPVGFGDSFLRNLLRAADFLPMGYAVGLLVCGTDKRFRRLGDLVAKTMVICETRTHAITPLTLNPPAQAAELQALPLRPPVSADERMAIEALLRRTRLSHDRASELAEILAPLLAKRMGVRFSDPLRFLGLVHLRLRGARHD